jgi:putative ABC transport system permease protein
MITNYFKVSYQNIVKNKCNSILNVLGLSIGMCACLVILRYFIFEKSYDTFHTNADKIYRVTVSRANNSSAVTNAPLGPSLKDAFSDDIESWTRAMKVGNCVVSSSENKNRKNFIQNGVFLVENNFLDFFNYQVTRGEAKTIFTDDNSVVITEQVARQYFGDKNPIGQNLTVIDKAFGEIVCKVGGVLKDCPENSHFKFKILVSLGIVKKVSEKIAWAQLANWRWQNFYTYVMLKPSIKPNAVEKKFPEFINVYGLSDPGLAYSLQPLLKIHLHSNLANEIEVNSDINLVYLIVGVTLLILLMAWINYANISVMFKSKHEVVVCQYNVCNKQTLMLEFMAETILINVFALLLATIFVFIIPYLLPQITTFIGSNENLYMVFQDGYWLWFLGWCIAGAFIAGFFPTLVLKTHNPYYIFKLRRYQHFVGLLRRSSLIFQITTTLILVVGTYVVYKQYRYMTGKDFGMNVERMAVINGPNLSSPTMKVDIENYKKTLLKLPNVESVSLSGNIPGYGGNFGMGIVNRANKKSSTFVSYEGMIVDENYLSTYQIKILSGRNFLKNVDNDTLNNRVIINESALKAMKFENAESAIGESFMWGFGNKIEIIGVIKDFHHKSLSQTINPLYLFLGHSNAFVSVRFNTSEAPTDCVDKIIGIAKSEFNLKFPNNPFEYMFMDTFFNRLNLNEQHFDEISMLFLVLSIGVFCILVYSLIIIIPSSKTKEQSWKNYGMLIFDKIFTSISLDFVLMILLSSFIAFPTIYLGVQRWLENYPYRISLDWTLFLAPSAFIIMLCATTVIIQTFRSVKINQDEVLDVDAPEVETMKIAMLQYK